MIEIREGSMNYKSLEDISHYFMFVSSCLSEEQLQKLLEEWEKQGGFKIKPWWKFVMDNTKVELDIKTE